MKGNIRIILFLILLGLAIRLPLISLPGFSYDVGSWFAWSVRLNEVNLSDFYSDKVFSDYLPGFLYIFKALGFLKATVQIEDNFFFQVLKMPAIISELGIGILIFLILKELGFRKMAFSISSFFMINPALIFNSTIWGQGDGVFSFFLLLSSYFLAKKYLIASSIIFAIAFIIKPQSIAMAPVFLLFLVKNFSLINLVKITLPGILTLLILSFPFFPDAPIFGIFNKVMQTASQYPYTSLNAYNFWGVVGLWKQDTIIWNGLSYRSWGYVLLALYWVIIAYFYFKKKISIFALAVLANLAFFFLPTKVHERYLYPALVFLILYSATLKSRLLLSLTMILSLIHLLNLYYVYIYYNKMELKLQTIIYNPVLYDFLAQNSVGFSLFSTIIFIIIYVSILKYDKAHKNT